MKELKLSGKPSMFIRRGPTPPMLARRAVRVNKTGGPPLPTNPLQNSTEILITGSAARREQIRQLEIANFRLLRQRMQSENLPHIRSDNRAQNVISGAQNKKCYTNNNGVSAMRHYSTRHRPSNLRQNVYVSRSPKPTRILHVAKDPSDQLVSLAENIKENVQVQNKLISEYFHNQDRRMMNHLQNQDKRMINHLQNQENSMNEYLFMLRDCQQTALPHQQQQVSNIEVEDPTEIEMLPTPVSQNLEVDIYHTMNDT